METPRVASSSKKEEDSYKSALHGMHKKIQSLKDELNSVHSKLSEFSQDLSDLSTLPSTPPLKANGRVNSDPSWGSVNMTTKMYQNSSDPNALPDRIFVTRDSLLTELFRISHIRTIRHIFISIMMIFALQVVVNDVAEKGKIDLNFNLIQWAFGNFTLVLYTWFYMKFFTACVVYCAFHYWSKNRVGYLISCSKKDDDLKAKKLPINMYDLTWVLVFVAYLTGFTVVPAYIVIVNHLPPASAMVILMEQLRLLMKSYAFVRSNIPRALENGDHFVKNGGFNNNHDNIINEDTEQENNHGQKVLCPDFSKYLYFLFAPTLVYRDNYPKTSRVNWNVVLSNFAQVVGSLLYVNYIFVRFCIPVFQDFNKEHVTFQTFVRSILNCHLSGSLLLLIGFFSFLHCWLNAWAEMLCFGDRMFYKDWWNSTNFQNYYRTWNCVVHDFLYTYIYKDTHYLVGKRYKVVSQFAIFFISAVFHEYVLTLALGFFYPVLFFMFGAIGFLCMFLKTKNNHDFFNFCLWCGLQIGLGGLMCLYSIEWYARQNCNQAFYKMSSSEEDEGSHKTKKPKTLMDQQRIQLEKLMANPNKEVVIPELKDAKKPRAFFTHEFVRNVMGASAGAGSGEFDIYRGCRRREMIRQEFLDAEDKKKTITEEFEKKLLENKLEDEARTAKKREKRLKAKQKLKNKKGKNDKKANKESSDDDKELVEEKQAEEEPEVLDLTEKVE